MLTECNVRDFCPLAASVEAPHNDSASSGFSQSCRRNIQENVPPNPRATLFSGRIIGKLRTIMLHVIGDLITERPVIWSHPTERPVKQEPYVSRHSRSQGAYGLAPKNMPHVARVMPKLL